MSKFKVGEIAIYQNLTNHPEWNGEECEVVKLLGRHPEHIAPDELVYFVKDSSGIYSVEAGQLKKKPEEKASLEEIQSITNWHPQKVTA